MIGLIIAGVIFVVFLLIGIPTWCVLRCFAAEQTRGPSWELDEQGYERWLTNPFDGRKMIQYPRGQVQHDVVPSVEKARLASVNV